MDAGGPRARARCGAAAQLGTVADTARPSGAATARDGETAGHADRRAIVVVVGFGGGGDQYRAGRVSRRFAGVGPGGETRADRSPGDRAAGRVSLAAGERFAGRQWLVPGVLQFFAHRTDRLRHRRAGFGGIRKRDSRDGVRGAGAGRGDAAIGPGAGGPLSGGGQSERLRLGREDRASAAADTGRERAAEPGASGFGDRGAGNVGFSTMRAVW